MKTWIVTLTAAALLAAGAARPAVAADGEGAGDQPKQIVPVVTAALGTVEVRREGEAAWQPARPGTLLEPGDTIRTGALSKAEVTHPSGVIRLFERTVLRLPMETDGGVRRVRRPELLEGQSLFDVVPSRIGGLVALIGFRMRSLFEVVTPHIVAGVKGTRFAVAERGARSVVAVYAGTVETSDEAFSAGETAVLGAGQLAAYQDGRLVGKGSAGAHDDWRGWADPAVRGPRAIEGTKADEPGKPVKEADQGPGTVQAADASSTGVGVGAGRGGVGAGGAGAGAGAGAAGGGAGAGGGGGAGAGGAGAGGGGGGGAGAGAAGGGAGAGGGIGGNSADRGR